MLSEYLVGQILRIWRNAEQGLLTRKFACQKLSDSPDPRVTGIDMPFLRILLQATRHLRYGSAIRDFQGFIFRTFMHVEMIYLTSEEECLPFRRETSSIRQ